MKEINSSQQTLIMDQTRSFPPVRISRAEGDIEVVGFPGGGYRVTLLPRRSDVFIAKTSCQTGFSLALIELFAQKVDYGWLCDAIARHDEPQSVVGIIRRQLLAYFAPEDFWGKRILDFGCGSGASSIGMALIFPNTEVVGIDLDGNQVELARKIANFRALANVRFLQSPSGNKLPPDIGTFDFVMLSAVYEHLLPAERSTVMPLLWSAMRTGGVLFINQTPHRYFPYEHHSTGLWLLNFLPDRLAHVAARNFSRQNPHINRSSNWEDHLRGGIRGATESDILRNLGPGNMHAATLLQPCRNGLRDRADYWLSCTTQNRFRLLKRAIASLFRFSEQYLGTIPSMNVDVAIRKDAQILIERRDPRWPETSQAGEE